MRTQYFHKRREKYPFEIERLQVCMEIWKSLYVRKKYKYKDEIFSVHSTLHILEDSKVFATCSTNFDDKIVSEDFSNIAGEWILSPETVFALILKIHRKITIKQDLVFYFAPLNISKIVGYCFRNICSHIV